MLILLLQGICREMLVFLEGTTKKLRSVLWTMNAGRIDLLTEAQARKSISS